MGIATLNHVSGFWTNLSPDVRVWNVRLTAIVGVTTARSAKKGNAQVRQTRTAMARNLAKMPQVSAAALTVATRVQLFRKWLVTRTWLTADSARMGIGCSWDVISRPIILFSVTATVRIVVNAEETQIVSRTGATIAMPVNASGRLAIVITGTAKTVSVSARMLLGMTHVSGGILPATFLWQAQ
jgi:hypothetical protein